MSVNTVTTTKVKECLVNLLPVQSDNLDHQAKLNRFLGIQNPGDDPRLKCLDTLKGNNFRVFVSRERVFKTFRYHAGIQGSYLIGTKVIDYSGDIPEGILNQAETARSTVGGGKFAQFTVHSMSPLPTVERYLKVDPVMILWITDNLGVVVGIWDGDKEVEFTS